MNYEKVSEGMGFINHSFHIHFTSCSSPARKELRGDSGLPGMDPTGASLKLFPATKNSSRM